MDHLKGIGVNNICIILLVFNCFFSNLGLYNYRTSPALFVSICLLILFILYNKKCFIIKELSTSMKIVIILMQIIGTSYAINGVIYKVPTYILLFILFSIILPIYFIEANMIKLNKVIDIYTKANIISFLIFTFAVFLFSPINQEQYAGIFNNPNLLGEYISVVIMSLIFQFEKIKNNKYKSGILILFGISVAFMIFSMSRTTLVSVVFIGIIYLIFNIRNKLNIKKKLLVFTLSILIMIPVTYGVLNIVTPLISDFTGINLSEKFYSEKDQNKNKNEGQLDDIINMTFDRYKKGIDDDRTFSSGRIEIWKEYFENLTFGGHDSSKLYIEYNGGIIQANAHNSFLQTAYQSGIMSGVSYLMIVLFLLIFGIKRFIKNADNNILFALMAMMSLFIYYCLSNILVPTISFSLLPMWIIIVPYIFNYRKSF
ncbi:MAG: O-antigen ligase family protein [Anaerovoracaceae bacterium]